MRALSTVMKGEAECTPYILNFIVVALLLRESMQSQKRTHRYTDEDAHRHESLLQKRILKHLRIFEIPEDKKLCYFPSHLTANLLRKKITTTFDFKLPFKRLAKGFTNYNQRFPQINGSWYLKSTT